MQHRNVFNRNCLSIPDDFFLCMFSCLQATILFLVRKNDPQTLELASIVIAPTGYEEASVLVVFMFCRSGQHIILFSSDVWYYSSA